MANMIPFMPREDIPHGSGEENLFKILRDNLDNNYYVVHSYRFFTNDNVFDENGLNQREVDFLIVHKKYGFLIIEAKNTPDVLYENGNYYYHNKGKKELMRHNGPYNQAETAMFELKKAFEKSGLRMNTSEGKEPIGFKFCTWFPQIEESEFRKIQLPPDASLKITITKIEKPLYSDPVNGIQAKIEKIFKSGYLFDVFDDDQFRKVLNNFICPRFRLVASALNTYETIFYELQREQALILDYLEDQKTAAIAGVAGTGKTLLAIEKARRSCAKGKVLFLCYNKFLCEYLKNTYGREFGNKVDFYTIESYTCHCTKETAVKYGFMKNFLKRNKNNFSYKTIVIDEGQDFGQPEIEDNDILPLLKDMVYDENNADSGEFYVFYDKNQMVQASNLSKVIQDSDCKLTLYCNCRNTKKIALTSLAPYGKIPKMKNHYIDGQEAEMTFANKDNFKDILDHIIEKMMSKNEDNYQSIELEPKDIVILTAGSIDNSYIKEYLKIEDGKNWYYYKNDPKKKIFVTTSRKFKGLESNGVILIDVEGRHIKKERQEKNDSQFLSNDNNIFYVAASRAKYLLFVIFNMTKENIEECMGRQYKNENRAKKGLINSLNGLEFMGD